MATQEEKFISDFSKFYEKFFNDTADSIIMLADIQKNYKDIYDKIQEFANNPEAIEDLIRKLSPEQQGILLNLLLQAGNFGKRTARLFEMSEDEKRKLAEDIKNFSNEMTEKMKKVKT